MHIVPETLSETQVLEDVSGVEMENQLCNSQDDISELDSTPCVHELETPNISSDSETLLSMESGRSNSSVNNNLESDNPVVIVHVF